MAYFNKNDFWRLLKLWRKTFENTQDEIIQKELVKDDEWLMKQFLPIHFIDEIERNNKSEKLLLNNVFDEINNIVNWHNKNLTKKQEQQLRYCLEVLHNIGGYDL